MAESEAVFSDGFPAGLRVFAVDDDSVDLRSLELMLLKCGYKVTVSCYPLHALELLRANKGEYDIVITDISMQEMDGYKLLEIVGIEMNLPVIMLSINSDFKSVMKAIKYGAVDYLVKPVRFEELMLIWKHVVKRSLNEKKDVSINELNFDIIHDSELTRKSKDQARGTDEDDNIDSEDNLALQKGVRITWTPELHAKFINAVNQLGVDRAVPKKILNIMQTPGLTRENVASHLQKYKKNLNRKKFQFSQQVFDNIEIRGNRENSLLMSINRSKANICRDNLISSSYLLGQQCHNGGDLIPQIWFPSSARHYNNLYQQYMLNSIGSQVQTQKANNCPYSWIHYGYTKPNSAFELGRTMEQQVEQEQRSISSGLCAEVEMDGQININSVDVQSYYVEGHTKSNSSDLKILPEEHISTELIEEFPEFDNLDYADDLLVALRQFQQ